MSRILMSTYYKLCLSVVGTFWGLCIVVTIIDISSIIIKNIKKKHARS